MENKKNSFANRHWVPKGSLELSTGFFSPQSTDGHINLSKSLVIDIPCIVLLGPPGIGKSTEFKHAHSNAIENGYASKFISLASIYTESDLESSVISSTEKPTLIFLDALDESPVSVPVIQNWIIHLAQKIKGIELNSGIKIPLRISARTTDWSEQFEKQLDEIWGKDSVQVFELAPFTEQQAFAFIESKTPEASEFTKTITETNSDVLASRPVTLKMLLNDFLANGTLTLGNRLTTYRRGILALLEESNQTRRTNGSVGNLEVEARFIIAARIAAASELSTKKVFWDGLYSDSVPIHAIPIYEIAGGIEPFHGGFVNISVKDIRETLRTGLFRQVEPNNFEWVHKTFSEFLAAYYIKEHKTSTKNALSFIRSNLPDNTNVIPQLREVAAWLGALDHDIWNDLVAQEPGLLLSSDVALDSEKNRSVLIDALLQKLDSLETYDKGEWRPYYKRLKHNELSTQLSPYIRNTSKNNVVRRTAIDIAEACLQTDLIDDLREVAFDPLDNDHIRSQATHALTIILPKARLPELLPLAIDPIGDFDDEIKGAVISALWPDHLAINDLFRILTEPKNKTLIGSYSFFIYSLKIPELKSDEALTALKWLKETLLIESESRSFPDVIPSLLVEIWKNTYNDDVLTQLASFVIQEIRSSSLRYETELKTFQHFYSNDVPSRRKAFVLAIFKTAPEGWPDARLLTFTPWQIVVQADLPWLVDELLAKSGPWPDEWLIDLIISLIYWENSSELEYVLEKSENHTGLKQALVSAAYISLDSEFAKWKQEESKHKKEETHTPARPTRKQNILTLLNQCENEHIDAFWRLNLALLEDDDNQIDELTGVLAPSPGWNELSIVDRSRVLKSALRYLNEYRIQSNFLKPNTHNRSAVAGYRALRLLSTEDPSSYKEISTNIWSTWALSILSFSTNDGETERENHRNITKDCFDKAPEGFISALSEYLKVTNSGYQVIDLVKGWASDSILETIWTWFKSFGLEGFDKERIFSDLVKFSFIPAIQQGYDALKSINSGLDADSKDQILYSAATILAFKPNETWEYLEKVINDNKEIARELITLLVTKLYNQIGLLLTAFQQAQLYVWIEVLFEKRRKEPGIRVLDAVDQTFNFQESLLRKLIGQGTSESVRAINWIANQLPDSEWLTWSLSDAKENQRRVGWVPPSPRNAIEQVIGKHIEAPKISNKEKIIDIAEIETSKANPEINFAETISEALEIITEEVKEAQPELEKLTYLLVSSEWNSHHGGISTFNRNLCIALAEYGHKVYCFIPNANTSDIERAAQFNVEILISNQHPGLSIDAQLARGPIKQVNPDVVIGHDHITGSQALALAREEFECLYMHFIHTCPEEIEPFKDRESRLTHGVVTYSRGNDKGKEQTALCFAADVVLTVGPKLERSIKTSLVGEKDESLISSILPGLNQELVTHLRTDPNLDPNCLITGRMADATLKGLDFFIRLAGEFYANPKSGSLHKTKFIVRGFDEDSMDIDIQNLKKQHDVDSPFIVARPFVSDEKQLMRDIKAASLFLMPSKTEGFGLAGLEAIAAGIPVIISADSGLGETLITLAHDFQSSNLKRIATECVIDTHPDGPGVLNDWFQLASIRLGNISKSFSEANDLRNELKSKLTWSSTAYNVTKAAMKVLKK